MTAHPPKRLLPPRGPKTLARTRRPPLSRDAASRAGRTEADRLAATVAWAEENLPGWTPDIDGKITEFAVREFGLERHELAGLINPKTYRAVHRQWRFERAERAGPASPGLSDSAPSRSG